MTKRTQTPKQTNWKKIIGSIPEIIPRLRELRKERPSFTASQFAGELNKEFKDKLDNLNTKIYTQHLTKILNPKEKQFTAPNGNEPSVADLTVEERKTLSILKKEAQTVASLSEALGIAKEAVYPTLDKLRLKGYDVVVERSQIILRREPVEGQVIVLPPITKQTIKFLVMSDVCLGYKTQQGDLLATAYKIGEEEGVFFAIIAGNLIAGKAPKAKENEFFLYNADEQVNYAVSKLPKAPFKTYFISGPREATFRKEGLNVGEMIAEAREDIRYCGDEKAVFELGKKGLKMAVLHVGENVTYTKSYSLQGVMENFQESINYAFEHSEPLQMVFVGGIHSYLNLPRRLPIKCGRYNDFDGIAIPALYRTTASQKARKKKGVSPVLGCIIVTVDFDKDGNITGIVYDARDLTPYHKDDDYLEDVNPKKNLSEDEIKILLHLKSKPRRKGELERLIQRPLSQVETVIENLRKNGYDIPDLDIASKTYCLKRGLKVKFISLDTKTFYAKSLKMANISDTHLGCKHSRPDLLAKAYQIAEAEKVNLITHSGDVFEGEDAYKGQIRDLVQIGADAQRDYGLEIWPKSKILTVFVRGTSHELVYLLKCGHDIVDTFVKLAPSHNLYNLRYLPGHRGVVELNGIKIELMHPKGGIPYGKSYRLQKRIEQLVSVISADEDKAAKVTFVGHLHIAALMLYKGMAAFLVPCMEDQTEYLSAKDLVPWLGMWISTIYLDKLDNITRIVTKYIPFSPKNEGVTALKLD